MITTYSTAVTDTANEILGKERRRNKQWVTRDVFDLCDERRDLKKEGSVKKKERKNTEKLTRAQKALKKAKEDWIYRYSKGGKTPTSRKYFYHYLRSSPILFRIHVSVNGRLSTNVMT